MPIRPLPLNPRSFAATVHRSPFALIRLARSSGEGFHAGVGEYFAVAYPRRFAFGLLPRSTVTEPGWLERTFQTRTGAMRHGVRDGYFVFESGQVIGHHLGVVRPSTVSYGDEREHEAQRERIVKYGFAGREPRAAELEAARQIVVYLDTIVARKLGSEGFGSGDRYVREERERVRDPDPRDGWRSRRTPPPPPPPPEPEADPYETLGVTRASTDDEVKKAYRELMKLNHPDKVSHLSPALQKFATQQVLELKKAYDAIVARRRR